MTREMAAAERLFTTLLATPARAFNSIYDELFQQTVENSKLNVLMSMSRNDVRVISERRQCFQSHIMIISETFSRAIKISSNI